LATFNTDKDDEHCYELRKILQRLSQVENATTYTGQSLLNYVGYNRILLFTFKKSVKNGRRCKPNY